MSTPLGQGYRGVEGRLGYLLRQAYQAMRGQIDAAARAHGITAPQFSVMSVLDHEPGLSGAQVARQSMLRAQTVHEIVLLLERDGLAERRPDPSDRRARVVFLTAEGTRVLRAVDADVARIEREALDGASIEQQQALISGLVRCAERCAGEDVAT
jgi:DNA-binding MarR family transcriptional regulator